MLLALCLTTTVKAQSVATLKQEQAKLQKDIELTQKMLKETKRNEAATENKLNLLGKSIKTQKQIINSLDREIIVLDAQRKELSEHRENLLTEQGRLRDDYARLVRETHYAQLRQSPLLYLLCSESFQQALRRVRYLQEFAAYRQSEVRKLQAVEREIALQDKQLEDNRSAKQKTMKEQKRRQEDLARDQRKQKKMLQDLKKKEKDLAAKQKKQQKRIEEIDRLVAKQIEAQTKQQKQQKMTKEQELLNGGFVANKGRLPWPVAQGVISHHFGKEQRDTYVTVDNKGIYLQTTQGQKARAVYEGQVTACMNLGNTYAVIVQHGTFRTVYSGISILNVKTGDKVATKQTLGTIYSDPAEDNKTELYFQIYEDKNIRNPELWLAK